MTYKEARFALLAMGLVGAFIVLIGALNQAEIRAHEYRLAQMECDHD